MDQRGDYVGVDDCLNLSGVPSCDVGDRPACFLANAILLGAEQGQKSRKRSTVNDYLCLDVITSHNVAN